MAIKVGYELASQVSHPPFLSLTCYRFRLVYSKMSKDTDLLRSEGKINAHDITVLISCSRVLGRIAVAMKIARDEVSRFVALLLDTRSSRRMRYACPAQYFAVGWNLGRADNAS